MSNPDDFLFPFFEELRREGMPLGVEEYLEAVGCIRAFIGLESPGRLCRTLCAIWAKSREDREQLQRLFSIRIEPLLRPALPAGEKRKQKAPSGVFEGSPKDLEVSFEQMTMKPGETREPDFRRGCGFSLTQGGSGRFRLTPRFPVRRRQAVRAFRGLRRMGRVGPPEELDIDRTVEGIGQTGVFLGPVLRPLRKNLSSLLLLIDRQGSMDPFLPMVENLQESVVKGGMLGSVQMYYFHNCPAGVVYENPDLTRPVSLEKVLKEKDGKGPCTLVVGDAGAARGYFDKYRKEASGDFLKRLGDCTNRFAWINPLPKERWLGTTAESVSKIVSMFPLTENGLKDAVNCIGGGGLP